MHTNHRRRVKSKQDYPWDLRRWRVRGYRFFRSKERISLQRLRAGADPDEVDFPIYRRQNDDVWYYD